MKKIFFLVLLCLWASVSFAQTFPVNNLQINGAVSGNVTGTGNVVLQNGPVLSAANLQTPSVLTLTNATGLPIGTGLTGLGAGVASGLSQASTGTGGPVFSISPALGGTPTVPTTAVGSNAGQIANAAFVVLHDPCVSIMDWGGNNTGSANNDTAYALAIAALPNTAANICVYFPPGSYNFASAAAYTFSNSYNGVTIEGAGPEVTTLTWGTNGGLKFTLLNSTDSVRVKNLTLATTGVNSGIGIQLTTAATSTLAAALNVIDNVSIRGSTGYFGTQYFATAIYVDRVSNINFSNLNLIGPGTPGGVGISLNGTSSALGIVYNVINCIIDQWTDGIVYGPYVQGVQIVNLNSTNNTTGIIVTAGAPAIDQLSITNSQFNNLVFNVLVNSAMPGFIATGNLFLIDNSASGINLQATSNTNIVGNQFLPNVPSPTGTVGIIENGWVVGGSIITGNSFYNLNNGIILQSTSKNVNVQSNIYQANATNASNAGTSNVIGGGSP